MLGLEAKGPSRNFVNHARTFGVMTAAAGGDVVRVLPPLNISQRDIEVAEARLDLAAAAWTAQSTT
jgi:acetylornithine/N-succinyldiaminopimelate aminotransferase